MRGASCPQSDYLTIGMADAQSQGASGYQLHQQVAYSPSAPLIERQADVILGMTGASTAVPYKC